MRIRTANISKITYAQFVWEATAAANGKDIDEPNNPTRKQIQNIVVAPYYHAVSIQGITISENKKR